MSRRGKVRTGRHGGLRPGGGRASQRGAALILTLLVLAILVVLVVQFTFAVRVEESVVRNTEDDAALELAARGAISALGGLFRDDRKNGEPKGNVDTLADIWCDPNTVDQRKLKIGQVEVELTVEDLERRLPLCWLAEGSEEKQKYALTALQRLIQKLAPAQGIEPEAAAKLISERVKALQAAGQGQPAAPAGPVPPPPGPTPARRTLLAIEQLLDEEGKLDRRILWGDPAADPPTEGIAGYVTTWPLPRVNANTVLGPVLFGLLPEKDAAAENPVSLWESADEIVEAVRKRRIDPDFVATMPTDGQAAPATGEKGASRKWPGNPFAEVGQLQSAEVHPKLAKVFDGAPAPTGGGQQPPGGGPPGGGLPGGGQPGGGQAPTTPGQLFKDALVVESRYYAVKLVARLASDELQAPGGEQQGVQSVFRLVVFRSPSDQVTTFLLGESPE